MEKGIGYPFQYSWVSLVAQMVKNPPAMQETWVRPLGWEDFLEEGMATHSSILAWRIPRTEELDELQPMGLKESDTMSDLAGTQAESCYHPSPPSDVLYPNHQNLWLYMAKGILEM